MCNKCRHVYRNESAIYTCDQRDTCTVSSDQQKSHIYPCFTDTDYKSLLGIMIGKDNFHDICDAVQGFVKNTLARSLTISVAIFFCKLKNGLSNMISPPYFEHQNPASGEASLLSEKHCRFTLFKKI